MKPIRLRQVKKEIRVLGIAIEEKINIFYMIGVVFRGNKFLDGIIQIQTEYSELEKRLIKGINDSPHKNQIRCIIFHNKTLPTNLELNMSQIYNETNIPIIHISNDIDLKTLLKKNMNGIDSIQFFGIKQQDMINILRTAIQQENIPEAVRVANIILTARLNPIT